MTKMTRKRQREKFSLRTQCSIYYQSHRGNLPKSVKRLLEAKADVCFIIIPFLASLIVCGPRPCWWAQVGHKDKFGFSAFAHAVNVSGILFRGDSDDLVDLCGHQVGLLSFSIFRLSCVTLPFPALSFMFSKNDDFSQFSIFYKVNMILSTYCSRIIRLQIPFVLCPLGSSSLPNRIVAFGAQSKCGLGANSWTLSSLFHTHPFSWTSTDVFRFTMHSLPCTGWVRERLFCRQEQGREKLGREREATEGGERGKLQEEEGSELEKE